MIFYLVRNLLRKIHKFLILDVSVIPKKLIPDYIKQEDFLKIYVDSNKGRFTFNFKRCDKITNGKASIFTKNYLVELEIPQGLDVIRTEIIDNVLFVVKLCPLPVSKALVAGVLIDIYLDKFLEAIESSGDFSDI